MLFVLWPARFFATSLCPDKKGIIIIIYLFLMSCYQLPTKFCVHPWVCLHGQAEEQKPWCEFTLLPSDTQIRVLGPGMDHALGQMHLAVWVQPLR